jgi:VWFA-related protein
MAQILFLTASLFVTSLAQTPAPQKRKKIKDFGSSLKRLKWDPQRNAAVRLPSTEEVANSEDDVIRIDTSLVSCELLVVDPQGKSVAGLTAADFSIVEDDTPQTVGHFLTGDNINIPRTIVLIIDYSGSQLPYLKNSVAAAKVLVDKLGPNDLMAIVTDDVQLIQDFTSDKKKLKGKLDQLERRTGKNRTTFDYVINSRLGRSKQYSALMAALNEVFRDEDVRPIVIFQTDGDEALYLRNSVIMTIPEGIEGDVLQAAKDTIATYQARLRENATQFSLDDVYRAVERSRATVYTVVPGIKLTGLPLDSQVAKVMAERREQLNNDKKKMSPALLARLNEPPSKEDQRNEIFSVMWQTQRTERLQSALSVVAALTGGWTEFLETPEQADEIYSRIFSDITQRYIVGYYPTNKERDGKRRRIDFQVKGHPEYQVLGRRTYFAPGNP